MHELPPHRLEEPTWFDRATAVGQHVLGDGAVHVAGVWLYRNAKLLANPRSHIAETIMTTSTKRAAWMSPADLNAIEQAAEKLVLDGNTLVGGTHTEPMQRAMVVPLRWGSPRILIAPCGLYGYLGEKLSEEPFRAARLWRYCFDPSTDCVVSYSPLQTVWKAGSRIDSALVSIVNKLGGTAVHAIQKALV